MEEIKENNKIKTLILRICEFEHKILKRHCFDIEMSMQKYFLEALKDKLKADGLIK